MYKDRRLRDAEVLFGIFFVVCIAITISLLSDQISVRESADSWQRANLSSTAESSKKCVDENSAKLGLKTWCYPGCLYKVNIQQGGQMLEAQYVGDKQRYGAVVYSTYLHGSSAPLSCNHGGATQPNLEQVLSKAGVSNVHTIAPSGFSGIVERPPLDQYLNNSNYAPGAVQATPLDPYQQYAQPTPTTQRPLPVNNNPAFNFDGNYAAQIDPAYDPSRTLQAPVNNWAGGQGFTPEQPAAQVPGSSYPRGITTADTGLFWPSEGNTPSAFAPYEQTTQLPVYAPQGTEVATPRAVTAPPGSVPLGSVPNTTYGPWGPSLSQSTAPPGAGPWGMTEYPVDFNKMLNDPVSMYEPGGAKPPANFQTMLVEEQYRNTYGHEQRPSAQSTEAIKQQVGSGWTGRGGGGGGGGGSKSIYCMVRGYLDPYNCTGGMKLN